MAKEGPENLSHLPRFYTYLTDQQIQKFNKVMIANRIATE